MVNTLSMVSKFTSPKPAFIVMTTTRALLWIIVTLVIASGIDALASLVLLGWVGGMVTGAVFTGAGLFFIYLRWKEDRK